MNRYTGLLILEVRNSNPNGDPDRESDPRMRDGDYGEISPVSFKRKLRDLLEEEQKGGPVWSLLREAFEPKLAAEDFAILESRGRDRKVILDEVKAGTFQSKYWDARVFGCTFLEEKESHIRTGVVQVGVGTSVAPIIVERMTMSSKSGVETGKDRGLAPLAFRVVQHGVYTIPFFVNPSGAKATGCSQRDLDLLFKLIPFAYSHTASQMRSAVEIRHAWLMEHKSPLGSVSDFQLLDALRPTRKGDSSDASSGWEDYEMSIELPATLLARLKSFRDLAAERYAAASA